MATTRRGHNQGNDLFVFPHVHGPKSHRTHNRKMITDLVVDANHKCLQSTVSCNSATLVLPPPSSVCLRDNQPKATLFAMTHEKRDVADIGSSFTPPASPMLERHAIGAAHNVACHMINPPPTPPRHQHNHIDREHQVRALTCKLRRVGKRRKGVAKGRMDENLPAGEQVSGHTSPATAICEGDSTTVPIEDWIVVEAHDCSRTGGGDRPARPNAGRYVASSPIGSGTFGTVCRAVDTRSNAVVVIKKITQAPRHFLVPLEGEQTEGEITSQMAHPAIVRLFDFHAEGHRWQETLILEFCPGGDLLDAVCAGLPVRCPHCGDLRTSIPLVPPILTLITRQVVDTKSVVKQVVQGLQYVHSSGFVHCDIKPENVLLFGRRAKLCDFGLAGQIGQCRVGPAAGTTIYMCPELAAVRAGSEYRLSPTDDVWSLAVLLYTVIFAEHPWEMATAKDERYVEFVYDRNIMRQPPWCAIPTTMRRCLIAMLEGADHRPKLKQIARVLEGRWPGEELAQVAQASITADKTLLKCDSRQLAQTPARVDRRNTLP